MKDNRVEDRFPVPSRITRTSPFKLNQRGFSLLEVLMAVGIIGMGMVMFAQFSGLSVSEKVASSREDNAITLAQDKIEDIKNIALTIRLDHGFATGSGWVNPDYTPAGGWVSLDPEELDEEGNAATSGITFSRNWDVDAVSGANYLFDVTVSVKWNDGSDSVNLITRITQ